MTEKYSLLPINPQQLTPVQTALQRLSEKHPQEIEYTRIWCQLIPHYRSLENTFLDNLTLIKL